MRCAQVDHIAKTHKLYDIFIVFLHRLIVSGLFVDDIQNMLPLRLRKLPHTVPEKVECIVLRHGTKLFTDQPDLFAIPERLYYKITKQSQIFFGQKQITVIASVIKPVLNRELPRTVDEGIDQVSVRGLCPAGKQDQKEL